MASIIRIKRSTVSGNPSTLAAGELAYSGLTDNGANGGDRLYIGLGTETNGNAANHIIVGGKRYTDMVDAATSDNVANTLVKRDANGSIQANITGTITGNAETASKWLAPISLNVTGDATATFNNLDGSSNLTTGITLATVNSNVGQFGSATSIPVITVNGKGLVTGVSTVPVATQLAIAGNTGTDTIDLLLDTLTYTGGTGVDTSVTNNQVTISIGQDVSTTSDVTFNNVSVNGTLYSNDITATSVTVDGNAIITGDLTVQGTTTTVNSTTVAIGDKNIELSKDATSASQADGSGLTIIGPTVSATITYTAVDDRWNLNKNLNVGTVYGNLVGNASSADIWSSARNLSLTGDASATLAGVDGSTNVSATITLATVNNNVGTFGSNVIIPTFTVNGKGLVTAAGEVAIPNAAYASKGLASFDSNNFEVSSGFVSIAVIDGGVY